MKRLCLIALSLLILALPSFAAGTVTVTTEAIRYDSNNLSSIRTVTFSWVADASDHTVPSTTISATVKAFISGYYLFAVETNPGSTAPTDNYDIVINDADGMDILGGVGADRDTANTEKVMPRINGTDTFIPIDGTLTFTLTNNSVNSATGTVKLYFVR